MRTPQEKLQEWWTSHGEEKNSWGRKHKGTFQYRKIIAKGPEKWDISLWWYATTECGSEALYLSKEEKESITKLKELRNDISHEESIEIDADDYEEYFSIMREQYGKLLGDQSAQKYVDELDVTKTCESS